MENKILDSIGIFKRYISTKSDMEYGLLYESEFTIDEIDYAKKRMVRVYLPDGYNHFDKDTKYSVIYFSDGQNLVDTYLSSYGKWDIDKHLKDLNVKLICVGVDSAYLDEYRNRELCPPEKPYYFKKYENTYLDKYCSFIFNRLKPIIDKTFNVYTDKPHTAVGGSSMGGLSSFYMGIKYKDIVGYSLCFSPAFLLYKNEELDYYLKKFKVNPKDFGKFYFFVGGVEFEARFVSKTFKVFKHLKQIGFTNDQIALVYDSTQKHEEKAWSKYFKDAIRFWGIK